jgi:hypothetical protein
LKPDQERRIHYWKTSAEQAEAGLKLERDNNRETQKLYTAVLEENAAIRDALEVYVARHVAEHTPSAADLERARAVARPDDAWTLIAQAKKEICDTAFWAEQHASTSGPEGHRLQEIQRRLRSARLKLEEAMRVQS